MCYRRVNVRGLSGISVTAVMAQQRKGRGNIKPAFPQSLCVCVRACVCASTQVALEMERKLGELASVSFFWIKYTENILN